MKQVISIIFFSSFLLGYLNSIGNTDISINDSIIHQTNDTIVDSTQQTIHSTADSSQLISDTIIDPSKLKFDTIIDSLQLRFKDSTQQLLNAVEQVNILADTLKKDTSLSEKADTTWNLSRLSNFIEQDTLNLLSDTFKSSLRNVLWHFNYPPVDSSISLIKKQMQSDTLFHPIRDSLEIKNIDSLRVLIENLIKGTEKDSVGIILSNSKNDTIDFWLKSHKKQKQSERFILYDERDIPAGIYVYPKGKNSIRIELDKNTLIQETKTQQTIIENISTPEIPTSLKQNRQINMIFPQWDFDGVVNLKFNQAHLSNWVQGGEDHLSSLLEANYSINYKKGKTIWDSNIEYKFGLIQSSDKEGIRKQEDILEINSKYGSNANKDWYYSALVNFKTQFFKGYEYPNDSVAVSGFWAPAYTVFSLGMDYKPSDKLTIMASPISSKITMMRNTSRFKETKFGLEEGQSTKKEIGAYFKSKFEYEINENMHLQNKINLFTNYIEDPQNIDVDWEVTLDMQITDYINTTISTHLIYDDDVEIPVYEKVDGERQQVGVTKKIQFKEVLSVGLNYKFR